MSSNKKSDEIILHMTIHPVTAQNLDDLIQLFESNGNTNYCWCMTWRMSSSQFRKCSSEERKKSLIKRIDDNIPVGLLGYLKEKPIAWCSVAPRETYSRLVRSSSIKKGDDRKVWSIVCLFIKPNFRNTGLSLQLLKKAIKYANSEGAEILEGYPVKPKIDKNGQLDYKVSYRFMGYESTFLKAGFKDVTPEGSTRKIMRYEHYK